MLINKPNKTIFNCLLVFLILSKSAVAASVIPPKAHGEALVHEFYTDVPWQQKLGTYDGNSFTVPFAIPYEGLSSKEKLCDAGQEGECILKFGIVNIIGIERNDRAYAPQDGNNNCRSKSCVEVVLNIGNYSTRETGKPAAIAYGNVARGLPYKGYVISIGTTYLPQLPWYLSHFCEGPRPNDVCYADYFTDIINLFSPIPKTPGNFPADKPWYVFNQDANGLCPGGEHICRMQLGALDIKSLDKNAPAFEAENEHLVDAFNTILNGFHDEGKFPWDFLGAKTMLSYKDLIDDSNQNPFLGDFDKVDYGGVKGPSHFIYPSRCTLTDLANQTPNLRSCSMNYEIHHGGFKFRWDGKPQWQGSEYLDEVNTYSRTSFLYAGVPNEAIPISTSPGKDVLRGRDKVETASIFSVYMPTVNAASTAQPFGRGYNIDFWHTLYLSNHRNMDVDEFISGVRGKILFHDEYRSRSLFDPSKRDQLKAYTYLFPASPEYQKQSSRYNAKSCDSCHLRNGSGVPLKSQRTPDGSILSNYVLTDASGSTRPYNLAYDYTFTHSLAPLNLRFVDLGNRMSPFLLAGVSNADKSKYFSNKLMNFYGKMFYVQGDNKDGQFSWELGPLKDLTIVDTTERGHHGQSYPPKQLTYYFSTPLDKLSNCSSYFNPLPSETQASVWPSACDDVNAKGILNAYNNSNVGIILLNPNRLVGMNVLEALPNSFILQNQKNQMEVLGRAHGDVHWVPGSRAGKEVKLCPENHAKDLENCYIGRFSWSAAAGTLEDQVSGAAAFPELNIPAQEGASRNLPFRFKGTNCGPANKLCTDQPSGSGLSEERIGNLADYMRWLGVFNRSEYMVNLPIVKQGEQVFRQLQCNTCHVIDKTALNAEDNVLPDTMRTRLQSLTAGGNVPFVSYIGTDMLVHDMGYLSQVTPTPKSVEIRNPDGTIKEAYRNYIYKLRTPPLMNLRFNHLATDAHLSNTNCDFLLHDGRACDAIEAAFLHDGPAVKQLNLIKALAKLSNEDVAALKAFLYSL